MPTSVLEDSPLPRPQPRVWPRRWECPVLWAGCRCRWFPTHLAKVGCTDGCQLHAGSGVASPLTTLWPESTVTRQRTLLPSWVCNELPKRCHQRHVLTCLSVVASRCALHPDSQGCSLHPDSPRSAPSTLTHSRVLPHPDLLRSAPSTLTCSGCSH